MRRDQFIKSVLALAAGSSLSLPSLAAANIKMMIPANPGGGWDTTGRALGKALQDSGVASSVAYENKGGAAGLHLPLGAGSLDVSGSIRALKASGYDGTITLEVLRLRCSFDSVAWMAHCPTHSKTGYFRMAAIL